MIEIQGKYNTAKIFTDIMDNGAKKQIKNLCVQPFAKDLSNYSDCSLSTCDFPI